MTNKHNYFVNGSAHNGVSPLDRGLAYGDGVFRTMKVANGMPEQWPLHYQKLVADCGALGIVCPSPDILISDIHQLFSLDETAVAKIIITRGDGARGYSPPAITAPMRLVIKSAMPDYPKHNFIEGVQLHVCKCRLSQQPALAGVKHLNRLENVLARMEWNDPAISDGIMLDVKDNVIECTAANIFARYDDMLITPDLSQCGVAGVTRQRILELAYTLNLRAQTEVFNLEKLLAAQEVMICNSLYNVWQVRHILDKTWPKLNLAAELRSALAS